MWKTASETHETLKCVYRHEAVSYMCLALFTRFRGRHENLEVDPGCLHSSTAQYLERVAKIGDCWSEIVEWPKVNEGSTLC